MVTVFAHEVYWFTIWTRLSFRNFAVFWVLANVQCPDVWYTPFQGLFNSYSFTKKEITTSIGAEDNTVPIVTWCIKVPF